VDIPLDFIEVLVLVGEMRDRRMDRRIEKNI